MATNKNKDATSLFELIGKSTLKVPKGAGSLKVPTWWNGSANRAAGAEGGVLEEGPVAEGAEPTAPASKSGAAVNQALASAAGVNGANGAVEGADGTHGVNGAGHDEANVYAANSAENADVGPAVRTAGAQAKPVMTEVPRPVARAPRDGGVFAPQTVGPRRLARRRAPLRTIPTWALVGAGLGLAVLVLLGVGMLRHWGQGTTTGSAGDDGNGISIAPGSGETSGTGGAGGGQRLEAGGGGAMGAGAGASGNGVGTNGTVQTGGAGRTPGMIKQTGPTPPIPAPPKPEPQIVPGRIVPAAEVQRVPGMHYLVITSSADQRIILANANFLVQHGMSDITIEQKTNGMYSVISVQGFEKLDDPMADALRKKAIEIGKEHPDAKKQHRSVYFDAYYKTVVRK